MNSLLQMDQLRGVVSCVLITGFLVSVHACSSVEHRSRERIYPMSTLEISSDRSVTGVVKPEFAVMRDGNEILSRGDKEGGTGEGQESTSHAQRAIRLRAGDQIVSPHHQGKVTYRFTGIENGKARFVKVYTYRDTEGEFKTDRTYFEVPPYGASEK